MAPSGLRSTTPSAPPPASVAIGDINGDGQADLAVANSGSDTVSILLGNGTGTFFGGAVNYGTGFSPRSVVMGDINGDGKPDLAVANANSDSVSILLGNGTGTVAPATNYRVGAVPYLVAMGDLNGDGKPDLAFSNTGSANVSILLNTSCSTVPMVTADRTSLAFSAVSNGAAFSSKTSTQSVRMTQTGTADRHVDRGVNETLARRVAPIGHRVGHDRRLGAVRAGVGRDAGRRRHAHLHRGGQHGRSDQRDAQYAARRGRRPLPSARSTRR